MKCKIYYVFEISPCIILILNRDPERDWPDRVLARKKRKLFPVPRISNHAFKMDVKTNNIFYKPKEENNPFLLVYITSKVRDFNTKSNFPKILQM